MELKNYRLIKRSVILIIFILICLESFARAGGGSSGGYGGRLNFLITFISVIIFFSLLYLRTRQSKRQILESEKLDSVWDYDTIEKLIKESFIRMQNAWTKKDLSLVKDIITENLEADFNKKINHLIFLNQTNFIEDIEIKSVKIIGAQDCKDNEKDSFTAYKYGSIVDYTYSGLTKHVTINASKKSEKFSDLYYFVRHKDCWLIDRIDNDVKLSKIYNAKHIKE